MWPLLVVFLYPCVNDGANLTQPAKNIEVQYLLAEGAVEPLHILFLRMFAGLSELKVNPVLFSPSGKLRRDKFRAFTAEIVKHADRASAHRP